MICRCCGTPLEHIFLDLGKTPLANSFLQEEDLNKHEELYPLCAYVCHNCFLVQVDQFETPSNIFTNYAYFSSNSSSWLEHCKRHVDTAISDFNLNSDSLVVEIASNDGYLLQYFVEKQIPVLGIEPAANVAETALNKNIPTEIAFFGSGLASKLVEEGKHADLIIAKNVLAHVHNLHNFIAGLKILLKSNGYINIEVPHLMRLIDQIQFDTIYHEHFSYFSLTTLMNAFARHQLQVTDVTEQTTHGGSLRIQVRHLNPDNQVNPRVEQLIAHEDQFGLTNLEFYSSFESKVRNLKESLLQNLKLLRDQGKKVVGYGAPAKGNTLLNYCGIGLDLLSYTVDKSSFKQDLYLPGTHIPILSPEHLQIDKPDYIWILPWNLRDEIINELSGTVSEWGGKFITAVPHWEVV